MTPAQMTSELVSDVVSRFPVTAAVFARNGMGCVGCAFAGLETIREAAESYGLDPDELAASLAHAIDAEKRKSI